jgi:hypothetical protein
MLQKLRLAHAARCRNGKTFAITPKAMAAAGTLPGFTHKVIGACRDILLDAGFIELVTARKAGAKRQAAQYRLVQFKPAFA